jgi:hypothetical protein
MNQYNANNVNGHRTRPEFKKELDFYVPFGAVIIELKECYDDVPEAEPENIPERILRKTTLLSKEEDFQQ